MAERPDDRSDGPASASPSPRRRLDGRTIVLCVAIAAVGALGAGLIAYTVLGDEGSPEVTLAQAREAPTVPFTRFDGSEASLADYRGQKLVVNFFASTCLSCEKEMPAFESVQRQAGDEVTFVGLAVQDDPAAAQELVEQTGVTYDIGQDPQGDIIRAFGGAGLPFTAFVAADGTVLDVHTGAFTASELRRAIDVNLLAGG